jgi:hypothetical protein
MDKFIVHFKSVSESENEFSSHIEIYNASNVKNAIEKAYAQLTGSPQGKNMIWEFDRVEVEE